MWLHDDRPQLLLKFVIITVTSETSWSQYFQAKLEFDNLLSERTPAANVSSESILRCAIFCEKGCECFSFNLITGVCLLYDTCYPFGMTVNETACYEWGFYAEHRYCFSSRLNEWKDAKNACNMMNAYLVEIESREEHDWIKSKVTEGSSRQWIGLTDETSEGNFYWEHSRSAPNFTFWAAGEPFEGETDNCGVIKRTTDRWFIISCTRTYSFICEG